ncbi:dnaj subfamily c member 17-like protein [Diplodia corticola]|uniref:Dnaj subfamily c member 17-like protein n=1 Tax=Diplodia corticola TaxID=236234 RepID=A0A1J9RDF8_9PEZI|nr:dnaj subfamily c member 17-like protein [Diplodia corticola]OJD30579.1 dnaj subfamily c member 17-like protein [Diplodia corticola]
MSKDAELSDEAAALIKSDVNLYELLGLDSAASACDDKAIKSAWRKTSLKYHPDKNRDDAAAVDKFYLAKNAAELLQNAEARAKYDAHREAKRRGEAQRERLEGKRRRLMDELERAERGAKRKREEEVGERDRVESEVKRLARDGERRRREREEARAREREEEARREEDARRERERERRRQDAAPPPHWQPGASVGSAAATREDAAATPVKKRMFDGAATTTRSAPSTPAGKKPAFSFSPKPAAGGGNRFEQDTLARLKAKQEEKRKLAEQIRAQEAAETQT